MSANGAGGTTPSRFFLLHGEIRNSMYQNTFEESNEDTVVKWALDSARVSHDWYNEAMPVIVSSFQHSLFIRFNNVWGQTGFQMTKGKGTKRDVAIHLNTLN